MIPGMDPRQVSQAMKKMGIKQEEIPASEVVIKAEGKDIVIKNPNVVKINMMGDYSFQVTGEVDERKAEMEISQDDVNTVMEQAGVTEEQAKEAIKSTGGDLAESIMHLKK